MGGGERKSLEAREFANLQEGEGNWCNPFKTHNHLRHFLLKRSPSINALRACVYIGGHFRMYFRVLSIFSF